MKWAAVMSLLATTAAADPQVSLHMYPEKQANGAVGEIQYDNQLGNPGMRDFFIQSPYGEIEMLIHITANGSCNPPCPDTLEVLGLPMLLVAIPYHITTHEGDVGVIVLYHWEGM